MIKIRVQVPRPRNPFAVAARRRPAGAHRSAGSISRRAAKAAMRVELLSARRNDEDGPI